MNLVEIYLKELISVEPYAEKLYPDLKLVRVDAIWNCYGNEHQRKRVFNEAEWQEIQTKGYYLG